MPANRAITAVLTVVAVILMVIAVIYFAVPASSLPSFMGRLPSSLPGSDVHRVKRGVAALVVGLLALGAAWVLSRRQPRAAP